MTDPNSRLLRAGWLLGVGLGGFIDGIVLHQLLQWHNMLSAKMPPIDLLSSKVNMFWDGVFHAAVWIITAFGVQQLWRAAVQAGPRLRGQGQRLFGSMLLGWASFNIVEGVVDHHMLGLHHVRDFVVYKLPWDLAFLGISVLLALIGWILVRRPSRPEYQDLNR